MNQKQEKIEKFFCGAPSGQIMCVYVYIIYIYMYIYIIYIMHPLTRYKEYVYIYMPIYIDMAAYHMI